MAGNLIWVTAANKPPGRLGGRQCHHGQTLRKSVSISVHPWLHRFFSEVRIHPAPCFRALLSVPSVSSCSKTAFFRVFRVFRGFKPQPLIPESFATDQARISHFLVWATRPQDDACGGRRCILTLTPYRRFPNRLYRRFPNRQSEDSSRVAGISTARR